MKQFLLCAAAMLTAAAPGAAHAHGPNGYLDLSYGQADVEGAGDALDVVTFGGAAKFSVGSFGAQADAHWAHVEAAGGELSFDQGALHAFQRTESHLLGAFASIEDLSLAGGQVYDVGVEGQIYLPNVTFDAGISYTDFDTIDDSGARYRLGATFFPTENFSFGANARRVEVSGDGEITTYSFEAEFQPSGLPASIFAAYRATDDALFSTNEVDTYQLGVRFNMGTDTLLARNRSGAGLPTVTTLVNGIY